MPNGEEELSGGNAEERRGGKLVEIKCFSFFLNH